MKFKTYAHKIVVYHQKSFREGYLICECARGVNVHARVSSRLCTFTSRERAQKRESSRKLPGSRTPGLIGRLCMILSRNSRKQRFENLIKIGVTWSARMETISGEFLLFLMGINFLEPFTHKRPFSFFSAHTIITPRRISYRVVP